MTHQQFEEAINKYGLVNFSKPPRVFKSQSAISLDESHEMYISLHTGDVFTKGEAETLKSMFKPSPVFVKYKCMPRLKDMETMKNERLVTEGGNIPLDSEVTESEFKLWDPFEYDVTYSYDEGIDPKKLSAPVKLLYEYLVQAEDASSSIDPAVSLSQDQLIATSAPLDQYLKYGGPRDKCMECGRRSNLWINIADGYVGCGRYHYGVADTGCIPEGGDKWREGAAYIHYLKDKSNCFLAIKLGTISFACGSLTADVFDYLQDDMVIDPRLKEHLEGLGYEPEKMKKTEKSMNELQALYNRTFDWSDSSANVEGTLLHDYFGLINLGNTCYLSSAFQLIAREPEVQSWSEQQGELFKRPQDTLATDRVTQLIKLFRAIVKKPQIDALKLEILQQHGLTEGEGLLSRFGLTAQPALRPDAFRHVWFGSHQVFGSAMQQDVAEYVHTFLDMCNQGASKDLKKLFEVKVENRQIDTETKMVKLREEATNMITVGPPGVHHSIMDMLTEEMLSTRPIHCKSFATGNNTDMLHHKYFKGPRPPLLWITVSRHRWTYGSVEKICDRIQVNQNIDITPLVAIPVDEDKIYRDTEKYKKKDPQAYEHEQTLLDMGLPLDLIRAAIKKLGPFSGPDVIASTIFEEGEMLLMQQLDDSPVSDMNASNSFEKEARGPFTSYEISGVIVHTGSSFNSGHYICYKKLSEDNWIVFNDSRVLKCPPGTPDAIRSGYLFLYKAIE